MLIGQCNGDGIMTPSEFINLAFTAEFCLAPGTKSPDKE